MVVNPRFYTSELTSGEAAYLNFPEAIEPRGHLDDFRWRSNFVVLEHVVTRSKGCGG